MDAVWEFLGKVFIKIFSPIIAFFAAMMSPIFVITKQWELIGTYWLDILISFGISGICIVYLIFIYKKLMSI